MPDGAASFPAWADALGQLPPALACPGRRSLLICLGNAIVTCFAWQSRGGSFGDAVSLPRALILTKGNSGFSTVCLCWADGRALCMPLRLLDTQHKPEQTSP